MSFTTLENLLLRLFLVFYFVSGAISISCYTCSSDTGGECYKNPKQSKFLTICKEVSYMNHDFDKRSSNSEILSILRQSKIQYSPSSNYQIEHDCATLEGTVLGVKGVARACSIASVSCSFYEEELAAIGFKVEKCDRCNTDGCNSSTGLVAGFLSVAASLILLICSKI